MMIQSELEKRSTEPRPVSDVEWSYDTAFSRHRGLIDSAEQEKLRNCRVAIAGLGGVGGVHLITLARLGIGAFHIADPDRFDLANFNRQYGATTHSLGRSKAEEMAAAATTINPQADLRVFSEAITPANVGTFLHDVDVFVDGIDFFSIEARRLVFREAQRRGIWTITAGPIGFSTAWLVFDPHGMSFDDYFDLHDDMDRWEQIIAFSVGLSPRATHLPYFDFSAVDPKSGRGPSVGLSCQLCAGVTGAEIVKILLGRTPIRSAPHYSQFDAYRGILRTGRLRWGNRHPLQRFKRWYLRRRLRSLGVGGGV